MTLQIGWRHDPAKITQKWRHEPANWQFLQGQYPTLFGIAFDEISLLDLVQCAPARESLQSATEYRRDGKLEAAFKSVAVSFFALVDDYEKRKTAGGSGSSFSWAKPCRSTTRASSAERFPE